jgi:hypothetical protein
MCLKRLVTQQEWNPDGGKKIQEKWRRLVADGIEAQLNLGLQRLRTQAALCFWSLYFQ